MLSKNNKDVKEISEIDELIAIINNPADEPRTKEELKKALKYLQCLCFSKKSYKFSTNTRTRCAQCLKTFPKKQDKIQLSCKCLQSFHENCLLEYLFENNTTSEKKGIEINCPSCKQSFKGEALKQILGDYTYKKFEEKYRTSFFTCSICLEDKLVEDYCITLSCDHRFCNNCIQEHIETLINDRKIPIKCPQCPEEIDYYIIRDAVSCLSFAKYEIMCMQNVPMKSSSLKEKNEVAIKCPSAECHAIFIIDKNESYTHHKCERCGLKFCVNGCKRSHDGFTCEQFRQWLKENDEADVRFKSLMRKEQWRECPKCGIVVERTQDCPHMTCRVCKAQFCYLCHDSKEWGTCKHAT